MSAQVSRESIAWIMVAILLVVLYYYLSQPTQPPRVVIYHPRPRFHTGLFHPGRFHPGRFHPGRFHHGGRRGRRFHRH